MADSFAYLVDAGMPPERIHWYLSNGITCDDYILNDFLSVDSGQPLSVWFSYKQIISK